MSSLALLLLLVATASHGSQGMEGGRGLHRPARQYPGISDVGNRAGGRRHTWAAPAALIKPCIDIHEIANGQVVCRMSGCRMRCLEGFSFIETENEQSSSVTLSCDQASGKLMFREMTWTPQMTICSPLCEATCENGGTCVAPNRCACTGAYTGDTCSEEPMLGDQPHQAAPLGPNQRRVDCEPGTRMPDGSTSVTLTFRDNNWFFPGDRLLLGVDQVTCEEETHEEKKPASDLPTSDLPASDLPASDLPASDLPDSDLPISDLPTSDLPASDLPTSDLPTSDLPRPDPLMASTPILCHPPCRNGGQCVNHACSCPRGFWGPSCEVNTCTNHRFPGMLNGSLGGTLKKLKFQCHPGHHTRHGHDGFTLICQNGVWKLPSGTLPAEDDFTCIRD